MRPAVQVHQAVGLLPGRLVNGVEVAGDHQPPRPAAVIRGELAGVLVDAGVAGQDRPGPAGVHHEAGGIRAQEHPQPPFRRAVSLARGQDPPRRLVGVQVPRSPRPRRDRLFQRHEQRPGLRAGSRQRARGDLRSLPAQPRHQRVHAPPRHEPLREHHRQEPVGEQALPDRLRRPGRRHRRRDPAIAGPPVPAPAVRHYPHHDQPVQLLRHVIAAQARERRPALRAAVPAALEIPDHLDPGQVRVIPPPRPRPRAAFPARAAPALPALILRPAAIRRRLRPQPLRRPPEHHPLQNRQVSRLLPRSPPAAARSPPAAPPPAAPTAHSPPAPQPASPAATPRHPPNPEQTRPQPPRSTANTFSSSKSRTTHSVSADHSRHHGPPAPAT